SARMGSLRRAQVSNRRAGLSSAHEKSRRAGSVVRGRDGRRAGAGADTFRSGRADDRRSAAAHAGRPRNRAIDHGEIPGADRGGPGLHRGPELNPDARSVADALDTERRSGRVRGPLHGIRILLKDNIATADQMMTTAGSLALSGVTPPSDAFVAARLREAV